MSRDGLTIIHSVIGRHGKGDAIPVVRLIPRQASGRLTVIASDQGKAALARADGSPSALAAALLATGQSVVGFDPLFVGESLDPRHPVAHRPDTAHFETYNPSLAADQIQDLATVSAWARSRPDVREVSMVGLGLAGGQVLLARPLLEGLARTVADLGAAEDLDGSSPLPPALDLPGIYQFGGFKAAAALTAPQPLWLLRAGPRFDHDWVAKSYGSHDAADLLRTSATLSDPADLARWIDRGE